MIGAIVGEYFGGSQQALGIQIKNSAALFDFNTAWAAILVASILGIAFYVSVAQSNGRAPVGSDTSGKGIGMKRKDTSRRWCSRPSRRSRRPRCSASAAARRRRRSSTRSKKVKLQLKWVTQAQFAGYYAALANGYYKKHGLDVEIKVGGPDITPEQVVLSGQAQFGIDWLPNLFATREKGGKIVSVAQVFNKSGMTELTWKSSGITSIKEMRGKKVGVWCCGNEPELFAALNKNGINPHSSSDVTIVNQPFDMGLFLQKKVDAAAAMTYNELAQVLETKNPDTGKLYTLADLNVFKMSDPSVGTAMLEDNVFVTEKYLRATRRRSRRSCRRRSRAGSTAGPRPGVHEHRAQERPDARPRPPALADERDQQARLAELVGVGHVSKADIARTALIAKTYGVIKKTPSNATTYELADRALDNLKARKVDVWGKNYKPIAVKVTEGGNNDDSR